MNDETRPEPGRRHSLGEDDPILYDDQHTCPDCGGPIIRCRGCEWGGTLHCGRCGFDATPRVAVVIAGESHYMTLAEFERASA